MCSCTQWIKFKERVQHQIIWFEFIGNDVHIQIICSHYYMPYVMRQVLCAIMTQPSVFITEGNTT